MKVILNGYVGKDAEIRTIGDKQFLSFAIADKDKDKEGKTMWVSCTTNNIKLVDYIKKGKELTCIGKLAVLVYNGQASAKCHAIDIVFNGKNENNESTTQAPF